MIACLRSSRFSLPDGSGQIFLDLRRLHDITAVANAKNKKMFVVTERVYTRPPTLINARFASLEEARRDWREKAMRLIDKGMVKTDFQIAGFHEED